MHNGVRVLDIHGHVSVPPAANSVVVTMMGSNTPLEANFLSRGTIAGASEDDLRRSAQTHVDYLDQRSIDVQLIGPRPYLMSGWLPDHLAPSWTRYVNDLIHTQCRLFPDRFRGACQLPQRGSAPDTGHCLAELERCVTEYGFIAAYVSPDPQGDRSSPGMSEPYWYPLYERCSELDLPIIVHGTTSRDPRFAVVPNNYQLGFLVEQYLAGQFLAHSDVFERFPSLRVVLCHCGGALNRFIPTDPHISQRDLSENLFYDTCVYDLHVLEAGIKQRGISQLLFGTEAPGSGRAVRPESGRTSDDLVPVLAGFDFLSPENLEAIFSSNFERVIPALAKTAAA